MNVVGLKVKLKLMGLGLIDVNVHTFISVGQSGKKLYHIEQIEQKTGQSKTTQKLYISKEYSEIRIINKSESAIIRAMNNKYGMMTLRGIELIKPIYEDGIVYSNYIVELRDGGNSYVFNTDGKLLIPAIYRNIAYVFITIPNGYYIVIMRTRNYEYAIFRINSKDDSVLRIALDVKDIGNVLIGKYLVYINNNNESIILDTETLSIMDQTYDTFKSTDAFKEEQVISALKMNADILSY